MKLKEVFEQLTYGELSQMSIGGAEQGAITEENYPKIVSHVNLGLTALYKRFNLKEGRIKIDLQPDIYTYPINSKYAVNNARSREVLRYILDSTTQKFADDIHKIERVYAETGFELGLNDSADEFSVFTPSATVLRVPSKIVDKAMSLPDELKTDTLEIVYRANHPLIGSGICFLDVGRIELELPQSHLEPLLLYVASRVHTPTGLTNELNMGNNYYAKYEASCQQLEISNLQVDQGSQPDRIKQNGWV